jgi:hypothetical protein
MQRVLQVQRTRQVPLGLEPQASRQVQQLTEQPQQPEQAQRKPAIPVPDRLARRAFATALTLALPPLTVESLR